MTLSWMIGLLLLAAAVAWPLKRRAASSVVATALVIDGLIAVGALLRGGGSGYWLEIDRPWIESLGARLHLGADGVSLTLMALTAIVGLMAVATTKNVSDHPGPFHSVLALCLAGVMGAFCALDLLLFYLFWELMLIPMFLLVWTWGHHRARRAASKLLVFTQAGSLLLLVAIVGLALEHREQLGSMSFDLTALKALTIPASTAWPLMLCMVAGFAVKIPVFPLHSWLPDAHTEAPTAGSVVLAGLLLKTGAYGLLRFTVPLFGPLSREVAPVALVLGAAGIVVGAWLASSQSDLKRLVAYTSVSHMGFVVVGIYSFHPAGQRGAVLQLVCHALSTGGLFVMAGLLEERLGTRSLAKMGGLWAEAPRLGVLATILAMSSLGLPGLGNFVAEILVLIAALAASPTIAAVIAGALVVATVYAVRLLHRVFLGRRGSSLEGRPPQRLDVRSGETVLLGAAVALLVVLGFWPQPLLSAVEPSLASLDGGTEAVALSEEAP